MGSLSLARLSLDAGKRLQSSFTKWVHLRYEGLGGEAIPIYENVCFVLALLRDRQKEGIDEAARLLEHLLHFQLPSGNFPLYLHEYPYASSRPLAIHLLVPFFWIGLYFLPFLPPPLVQRFKRAVQSLHQYGLCSEREAPFPPSIAQKLKGFGQEKGEELPVFETSIDWENGFLAAQMLGQEGMLLAEGLKVWNSHLRTFTGRPMREFQRGFRSEVTLFDLAMGEVTGCRPKMEECPLPLLLRASVIFPIKKPIMDLGKNADWSFQVMEGESKKARGYHSLRILWGNHSFVCQTPQLWIEKLNEHGCLFSYPEGEFSLKKGEELSFYVDRQPGVIPLINGERATLFHLTDRVSVRSPTKMLRLFFSIAEGFGTFCGHLRMGNRPSQRLTHGGTAYDWQIVLRTIRRSSHLKVRLLFHLENHSSP